MKLSYILLAFLILAFGDHVNRTEDRPLAKPATGIDEPSDSMGLLADQYLSKLTELKSFNGTVLLKKEGKIVLRKAYNLPLYSPSSLRVTETSQYDLRSVAKLFAKVSLVDLAHENSLGLDDPLSKFIPDFPNGNQITIAHLLDHSSGLPRELSEGQMKPIDMSAGDVVRLAGLESLEFEPGSQSQYSNVGFQLLYYIIGQQQGSTFTGFLKENYFEPLQMNNSGSNFLDGSNLKTNYAYGHFLKDDRLVCECEFPDDEMQMGNLYSTVDDLDIFLSSLDDSKYEELRSDNSISHAGGTRGKRAYVERNFDEDYTIIFLANFDEIPFERLVNDLQDILLGNEVTMPKEINRSSIAVSPSVLKEYVGTYDVVDAGHLILSIRFENDNLYLYQKEKNNGVLYPETETVFFGDPTSEESIEFVRDSLGEFYMLLDFQGVRWKGTKISD